MKTSVIGLKLFMLLVFFVVLPIAFGYVGNEHEILEGGYKKRLPDICYNPTTGRYLVVWEENSGADDYWCIYGRIFGSRGNPEGDSFLLSPNSVLGGWFPRTACANSEYWTVTIAPLGDIEAFAIDSSGKISMLKRVKSWDLSIKPDIGGLTTSDKFLVVWQQRNIFGKWEIRGHMYSPTTGLVGDELEIANSNRKNPSVNQRGQDFFVAWEKHNSSTDIEIQGRRITSTGSMASIQTLSTSGYNINPSVADRGNSSYFLTVWSHEYNSNDYDIQYAFASSSSVYSQGSVTGSSSIEVRPCAVWSGRTNEFCVAYPKGSSWDGPWNVHCKKLVRGSSPYPEESIATTTLNEGSPEGTMVGGSHGKVMLTWDRSDGDTVDYNLYMKEWFATSPGTAPELSSGYVTPETGDTSTNFNYYVNYYDIDGDSPSTICVYIDGLSHTMSLSSGSASNGTYHYGAINLGAGSYNYYFYCSDGFLEDRLPGTGTYDGPTVSGANEAPQLSSGSVSPLSGDTTTNFYYYVDYYDSNGDVPSSITVYIDGSSFPMSWHSGSESNGTYRFGPITLGTASHNYYFHCSDGSLTDTLPPSGTSSGPTVSEGSITANFSANPTMGDVSLTVDFTDQSSSTSGINTWSWNFGDGGTSSLKDPSHQYTSAGTYTVSLTVNGLDGSDTETKTNYIIVNEVGSIIANFSASITFGNVPLTVDFADLSSSTSGISTWSWNFGDGGTSSLQDPSYSYTSAGTYTVSLTVSGPDGADSETKTDYIIVNDSDPVRLNKPVGFGGIATSVSSITWSWTDANTSPNETGHKVYNADDHTEVSGLLPADSISFSENSLSENTLYKGYVKAIGQIGGEQLDQANNYIGAASGSFIIDQRYIIGQCFVPAVTGPLTKVDLLLYKLPLSVNNITVEIRTDSGTEGMVVWGGHSFGSFFNDGAKYNPPIDTWTMLSASPVSGRDDHTAVWTGTEMIVWGGYGDGSNFNDGAMYNPETDAWTMLSASPLSERNRPTAVWTGTEMIIWGGNDGPSSFNNGARYNPATDTWTMLSASSLSGRYNHTAIWTGTEMIVWGGGGGGSYFNDGAKYNPATDVWTMLSASSLSGRYNHTAIWTGTEMIVWGGRDSSNFFSDGAKYNPATDTWTVLNASPLLERSNHTAVWTGTEMIVWGGWSSNFFNDGAMYNPTTDTWIMLSASPVSERINHTAVWTGTEMIVWGGWSSKAFFDDGARYNPITDTWSMLSEAPVSGKVDHTAVWIGIKPSSTVLASESWTFTETDTFYWQQCTFTTPPTLQAGTPYWIVCSCPDAADQGYYWGAAKSNSYNGPNSVADYDTATSAWMNYDYDCYFRTYMDFGAGTHDSLASNVASVYTLIQDATTSHFTLSNPSGRTVVIEITEPPNAYNDNTGVKIERATDEGFSDVETIQNFAANYLFTDNTMTLDGTYWYRITYCNGDGIASATSTGKSITIHAYIPPPPENGCSCTVDSSPTPFNYLLGYFLPLISLACAYLVLRRHGHQKHIHCQLKQHTD